MNARSPGLRRAGGRDHPSVLRRRSRAGVALSSGGKAIESDVTLFAVGGSTTSARLVTFLETPPVAADPSSTADELFHALCVYRQADDFDIVHNHIPNR